MYVDPAGEPLAERLIVPPEQILFTGDTTGVAGGLGSDNEKLNALDTQPLYVMVILEYVPDLRLLMI